MSIPAHSLKASSIFQMKGFTMSAVRISLLICWLMFSSSTPLFATPDQVPTAQPMSRSVSDEGEQAPGNRLLFSPKQREVALFAGAQDVLALTALGLFILIGLFQLRSREVLGAAAWIFCGILAFYSAWVYHKWTISGREVILCGHLTSWAVGAVGVALATKGVRILISVCRQSGDSSPISSAWLLPLAGFFTLGMATGTATIFEATPTIFGIDPAWHQIALMVVLGSCASAASVLCFVRALCRMK